jgi:ankyrin repeat protein
MLTKKHIKPFNLTYLAVSELDFLTVFLKDNGINVFDPLQNDSAKIVIEDVLKERGITNLSSTDVLHQIQSEFSIIQSSLKDKFFTLPKALLKAANIPAYPLHVAVRIGNLDQVKKLISSGYKINQTDLFGSTPLHIAAMYGHKEIAEYLISRGASIDASTYEYDMYDIYYTPVDLAIKYAPNTDTLLLLLQKGASPSNWNQALFTVIDIALEAFERNDYPTFDLILKKIEVITRYDSDGLWCWIDGEDMPIAMILETYSTQMTSTPFYNRLMDCVNNINEVDKLSLVHNYIAAKNLFHAFPSDNEYVYKIKNYPAEITAQGYHSVFTTALAYHSLHCYQQTLIGKLDNVGFKNAQAMFPKSNEAILKNVESYSLTKQTIFSKVEAIFKQGMDAKHHASLHEVSEELFQLYETGQTILLPCGWEGHAIDIILNKPLNLFIVANGGESYPGIDSGINAYNHLFTIEVEDIYHILTNHEKMEMEFKRYYDLGLIHNDEYSLILPDQEYGNCAWYSQQLSERALLFLELRNTVTDPLVAAKLSETWFEQLDDFHQTLVLKEYLEDPFLEVAALGDILINYHHTLSTPSEIERAKLILDNLSSPENKSFFLKFYNAHRFYISPVLNLFIKDNGFKFEGMREGDFNHEHTTNIIDIHDVIKMDNDDVLTHVKTVPHEQGQAAFQECVLQVAPLPQEQPLLVQLI